MRRAAQTEPTDKTQRRTGREAPPHLCRARRSRDPCACRHSLLGNAPRVLADDSGRTPDDSGRAPVVSGPHDDKRTSREHLRASLHASWPERCCRNRRLRGITLTRERDPDPGSSRRRLPTHVDHGARRHTGHAGADVGQSRRGQAHRDLESRRRRPVPRHDCRNGDTAHRHAFLQWRADRLDAAADSRPGAKTHMPGGSGHRRVHAMTVALLSPGGA